MTSLRDKTKCVDEDFSLFSTHSLGDINNPCELET